MRILLPPLALLCACSANANDPTAGMSGPEKASFAAIQKFGQCMHPAVARAKAQADITDTEIEKLGYACPKELDEVASTLAVRADYRSDEPDFRELSREQKAAAIKKDFAAHYWCEFRKCQVVH